MEITKATISKDPQRVKLSHQNGEKTKFWVYQINAHDARNNWLKFHPKRSTNEYLTNNTSKQYSLQNKHNGWRTPKESTDVNNMRNGAPEKYWNSNLFLFYMYSPITWLLKKKTKVALSLFLFIFKMKECWCWAHLRRPTHKLNSSMNHTKKFIT